MSMIFQKLKSRAGESLVESMAAILVFTFASIIMLSMVSAAADINTTAKDVDRDFQNQMLVVERASAADRYLDGTVTFVFGDEASSVSETVPVDIFQAENGDLYAYYAEAPTEGSGGEAE